MSDPLRRYLADGEELVLETRKSRAVLIGPAAWALLLLLVAAGIALIPASGALATVLLDAAAVLALAVVLRLGWTVLGWSADRVIVTDQRIFEISGVVTRRVSSMPLTKITDMTYRRGILGRLLGFGDFLLETAGESRGLSRLRMIPFPDHFYRTVTSLAASGPARRNGGWEGRWPGDEDGGQGWQRPDDEDTGPLPRVII